MRQPMRVCRRIRHPIPAKTRIVSGWRRKNDSQAPRPPNASHSFRACTRAQLCARSMHSEPPNGFNVGSRSMRSTSCNNTVSVASAGAPSWFVILWKGAEGGRKRSTTCVV